MRTKDRYEVAPLPSVATWQGVILDTAHMQRLKISILIAGHCTVSIYGSDDPNTLSELYRLDIDSDKTLSIDISKVPRFVRPHVTRSNPQDTCAVLVQYTHIDYSGDWGL